jgi:hypothetical protein
MRASPTFPSGRHLVLFGTAQLLVVWVLAFVLAARGADREVEARQAEARSAVAEAPAANDGARRLPRFAWRGERDSHRRLP